MSKPYSVDLRERVVSAVEEGGLSRRQAAARFGIADVPFDESFKPTADYFFECHFSPLLCGKLGRRIYPSCRVQFSSNSFVGEDRRPLE